MLNHESGASKISIKMFLKNFGDLRNLKSKDRQYKRQIKGQKNPLAIKLVHLHFISNCITIFVQYLIPSDGWPIYSGLQRRPLISLDVHD